MSQLVRLQIFKANDARAGIAKTGNPYVMQSCEVGLCDATGAVDKVGELMLPKDKTDEVETRETTTNGRKGLEVVKVTKANAPAPGIYDCTFGLSTDRDRRVIAVIETMQPVGTSRTPTASPSPAGKPL